MYYWTNFSSAFTSEKDDPPTFTKQDLYEEDNSVVIKEEEVEKILSKLVALFIGK